MTPEQRRELERLIDEHKMVSISDAAKYGFTGTRDQVLEQRCRETYGALMDYLDEVTDYSAAGAVSGS